MQSFIWSPSKQRLDLRWRWVLHCELPLVVPKHHEGHAPKSRLFSSIPLETREGRQKWVFIAPFAWRVLRVWRHACIFPALYFSAKLYAVSSEAFSLFMLNVATKLNSASTTCVSPSSPTPFFNWFFHFVLCGTFDNYTPDIVLHNWIERLTFG